MNSTVLILNSFGGLCNQMMDIRAMVSFAVHHELRFCFRNCSYRNSNLVSWTPEPFSALFNESAFRNIPGYENYADLNPSTTSMWNADGSAVVKLLGNILELDSIINNHDYVVLSHFWPIIDGNVTRISVDIEPSKSVFDRFETIRNAIPEHYNFLHYRYEVDFTKHFGRHHPLSKFPFLKDILKENRFKRPELPVYLGTSRAVELGEPHLETHISQMPNLFYTDELLLRDMNYEAAAYVDYLVGLNSVEVLGHSLSSFSQALNREKGTRNFYDNAG
jgi:hypothetical protein